MADLLVARAGPSVVPLRDKDGGKGRLGNWGQDGLSVEIAAAGLHFDRPPGSPSSVIAPLHAMHREREPLFLLSIY